MLTLRYIPPSSFAKGVKPKNHPELLELIKAKVQTVHEVDGSGIAKKVGNNLVVNTVLLGALSALPEIPVKRESFEKAMASRLKEKYLNVNLKAFQLGRDSVLR